MSTAVEEMLMLCSLGVGVPSSVSSKLTSRRRLMCQSCAASVKYSRSQLMRAFRWRSEYGDDLTDPAVSWNSDGRLLIAAAAGRARNAQWRPTFFSLSGTALLRET